MGAEAKATLRLGRQSYEGTALLESDELRFRGETRLRIPLADITAAVARAGSLRVEHAGGVATFRLGEAAEKWAAKIRSPRTLADKLGIKRGMRVSVVGIDDRSTLAELSAAGAELVDGPVPQNAPLVLFRVTTPAQLAKLDRLAARIARDGAIWLVHPRGVTAVADTVVFGAARRAGLTYTKVARFSATDTAEKLVIPRAAR